MFWKGEGLGGYGNVRVTFPLVPWSSAPLPNLTIVCTLVPSSGLKKDNFPQIWLHWNIEAWAPGRERKMSLLRPSLWFRDLSKQVFTLLPFNFFLLNNPKTFKNMCEGEHYPIWRTICTQVWGWGEGSHRNTHKHSQDVQTQIHIPGVDEGVVDPKSYRIWESPLENKKNIKVQIQN